jgi:hypothetical protein
VLPREQATQLGGIELPPQLRDLLLCLGRGVGVRLALGELDEDLGVRDRRLDGGIELEIPLDPALLAQQPFRPRAIPLPERRVAGLRIQLAQPRALPLDVKGASAGPPSALAEPPAPP